MHLRVAVKTEDLWRVVSWDLRNVSAVAVDRVSVGHDVSGWEHEAKISEVQRNGRAGACFKDIIVQAA